MNPVTVDIKDKLVAAGQGTFAATTGWGIYLAHEPITPNTTITIYERGGTTQYFQNRSKSPLRIDSFQVRVRGVGYIASYNKAKSVQDTLTGLSGFRIGDVRYSLVANETEILLFDMDERDRYIWIANYNAFRQED